MPKRISVSPLKIAKSIAQFASDKKAQDISILDMRCIVNFCDYFVICSGTSDRQVKAIANGIIEGLETVGEKSFFTQGMREGRWIVLDAGHVVTHIFAPDEREFYGLEYLWKEAKSIG